MSINGIRNSGAWGNIFTVNTPYLDNLGKQIYAQEQQRQLQQQRESDALDNQFSKEVANIRDADVNEYADKYNDWKQAKIGLMKMNPKNQKDYINAQMDANRKLADMSQFGANSIANKAGLKDVTTQYSKDTKGIYNRQAGQMIKQASDLPSSQWSNLGFNPTDVESYKYQANPDKWNKALQTAIGNKPVTKEFDTTMDKTEGIGTVHTTIKGMSSPAQVSQYLTTQAINNPGEFIRTHESQFPPERVAQITQDYNDKIANNPESDAYKLWGENGVKLPMNGVLTEQQALANTLAMNYALEHQPTVTKTKNDYNSVAMLNKRQANSEQMQQERFEHQKSMAKLNDDYVKGRADYNRAANTTDQENILNKFNDNTYNAGTTRLNGVNVDHIVVDGKNYQGKVVDIPNSLKDKFKVVRMNDKTKENEYVYPNAYYMPNDKKVIIPLFLSDVKNDKGGYNILKESKPKDIQNYKADLSNLLLTKSKTGSEVTGEEDEYNAPSDESAPSNPKVKKDPLGLFTK